MNQMPGLIPVVKGRFPWLAAKSMMTDPVKFLQEQSFYNGIYRVDAPVPLYILIDPDYIRYVLQKNSKNYEKGPAYKGLATLVGEGILTSEQSHWRGQRKMIQPSFHKEKVLGLKEMLFQCAEDKMEYINKHLDEKLEIKSLVTDYALDVIGTFLMGKELVESYKSKLLPLLLEQYHFAMMQNRTFFKFPLWVPTHRHRRFFKVKKELYRLIQNIISGKSTDPDDSVLSEMIRARDSEGRKMQEHELHDELITLFVTGFETTANALSWIFIRLAQHPNYQEKLYSEINALNIREDASLKDLMSSTWLKAVINETLRLHPPVWGYPRRCLNGDSIGGQAIPEKAHVHLSIFMAQRHPDYWQNPDEYRPERFVERADHPAFFPFGIGSRMCIGEHLAYLEMYSLVYSLISKFRVELTSHEPVEILSLITLHPKGDVYLKFSPRK